MKSQSGKPAEDNFMTTETISLFDKHIKKATLFALQTHFHAPSEHTIDGEIFDLEMHIVHQLDPNLVNPQKGKKSQFTNGVLGFIFKGVTDDYFEKEGINDYHDKFLLKMLSDRTDPAEPGKKNTCDMTEFVRLLKFNRRWTYDGSLTTAPFSEGILWNVIE